MAWLEVHDYQNGDWVPGTDAAARARSYCAALERGEILLFSRPPFALSPQACRYLIEQPQTGTRLHKNISYRPGEDTLRGFGGDKEDEQRVHGIMRHYSAQVTQFVSRLLAPYAQRLALDFASFRPLEEQGRDLPLHKKNDLLHVDAFPSRPTRGGRILRVFTNLNPSKNRVWFVTDRFPTLAAKLASESGLREIVTGGIGLRLKHALHTLGLPVTDRSPYDRFMLRFHDFLKENTGFQEGCVKEQLEFPPMATWLVFTDGVPHAALSGQFAMEQTFIIPVDALVSPEHAPIRVLENLAGRALA